MSATQTSEPEFAFFKTLKDWEQHGLEMTKHCSLTIIEPIQTYKEWLSEYPEGYVCNSD